ncbi:MAG TPA: PA2779 family protein [Burkholderiales bacterium]|nr:PA2779 family protein [Burkholderiales bacterium]
MKRLLGILIVACGLIAPAAQAEMIGTDQVVQSERQRVRAALERPEMVQALKKVGVDAKDAAARVDAMNDSEVAQIAGMVDLLPAGGAFTNDQLLIILLIVLILIIAL